MTEPEIIYPEFSRREALLQQLVDGAEVERRRLFAWGEAVHLLIRHDGNRKVALKDAAQALACSERYCAQLATVFDIFGWAAFDPMVPWAVYRACGATDKPNYWLGRAQAAGWSQREVTIQYKKQTGKDLDPESLGLTLLVKAEGEVQIEPDRIIINTDPNRPASVTSAFRQGARARIRIEGKPT